MLTVAENERLCRVTGNAPMGRMMRRYWIPACLSEEVAAVGRSATVRLLGDDLLAYRARGGAPVVRDADRLGRASYPVREISGMVWVYLGPGQPPRFPAYDWTALPPAQCVATKAFEHTNFAQSIEGSIDSAHSWFLHRGTVRDWKARSAISSDQSPRLEAEDTPYGFRYAAIRTVDGDPHAQYVRTTLFALPFTSFIPRPMNPALPVSVQIFVPVDDTHTYFYGVWFTQDGSVLDVETTRAEVGFRVGPDLRPGTFERYQGYENWWKQDRAAMRDGSSYTGISGVLQQDMAVQESMGAIVDRSREHLGTSDVAIIRMRRRMLDALERFEADGSLVGVDPEIPLERIRSEQKVIPMTEPWQSVGAYGGEFARS